MRYETLSNYCTWGLEKQVKHLLENAKKEGEDVDIFWDENSIIHSVVAHKRIEVFKVLLDYYEENYLTGDEHSQEYIYWKRLLKEGIQSAFDAFYPSPEILDLVKKYMPLEEEDGSDSTVELDDLPDPTGDYEDLKEGLSKTVVEASEVRALGEQPIHSE